MRAVAGVQAQDLRAAALALRARVPNLLRSAVASSPHLLRTWTVRGTAHLVDASDLPWLRAVTGPRNRRTFDRMLARRGGLERVRAVADDIVAVLEEEPRGRAGLLTALAERGHPPLEPHAVNLLVPWAAAHDLVVGLPDGRLCPAPAPSPVDLDEALATLARRYLAGYGPATAVDLARWSGLPLGLARQGLAAAGDLERVGDLLALPGAEAAELPPPPEALLLAPFDTLLLGYASRAPFVASADERRILPGGGMLRAVVLVDGIARGTWRLAGSPARRAVRIEWFGPPARSEALEAEARDVGRCLGLDVRLEG